MSLGENIYRLRTDKGMSQSELAEALNVSRQSISKWETDSSVPELDKLLSLSKLFGVSLDELVKGSNNEDEEPENAEDSENTTSSSGLYSLVLTDLIYDRESMARFLCDNLQYTEEKAWDLIVNAPCVISSGKYYQVVQRYAAALSEIAATKIQADEIAADPDKMKFAPSAPPPSPTVTTPAEEEKSEGMSFGGTVAAVVVGVVIAILILSIF